MQFRVLVWLKCSELVLINCLSSVRVNCSYFPAGNFLEKLNNPLIACFCFKTVFRNFSWDSRAFLFSASFGSLSSPSSTWEADCHSPLKQMRFVRDPFLWCLTVSSRSNSAHFRANCSWCLSLISLNSVFELLANVASLFSRFS